MVPLPEHEANKEIIGDLLKALLEELNLEFWSLGSTTFKNEQMAQGIEPDQSFQNREADRYISHVKSQQVCHSCLVIHQYS